MNNFSHSLHHPFFAPVEHDLPPLSFIASLFFRFSMLLQTVFQNFFTNTLPWPWMERKMTPKGRRKARKKGGLCGAIRPAATWWWCVQQVFPKFNGTLISLLPASGWLTFVSFPWDAAVWEEGRERPPCSPLRSAGMSLYCHKKGRLL